MKPQIYLQISERTWGERLWPAHQVTEAPWRSAAAVASVESYLDARDRALRNRHLLRFDDEAWQQMVEAGVAPAAVPADVTIT
ncbi:MAG: hypothetical protein JWO57_2035 [Pseudonocardiales bacterium]|jgi:hypothetical protein|nr:hypothetical protein [Pseudonocardiales bacterium]